MNTMDILAKRRSVRKYTGDAIPDEALDRILQAGLLAPSSRSLFPVDFIVVRDKATLFQLSRTKTAGSGMLKGADAAIVVIGNSEKSDAWIEDCSIAMIYMQLVAAELGIGACWVQCRGRISQQKKGEPLAMTAEDIAQVKNSVMQRMEGLVAATIARDKALKNNMTADDFLRMLLGYPLNYTAEAILSLGMIEHMPRPCEIPETKTGKIHSEKF